MLNPKAEFRHENERKLILFQRPGENLTHVKLSQSIN